MATAALDAFRLDTMTPEPEDLETLAPNSAVPSPPRPYSLAPEAQNLQSIIGPGDTLEEELRSKLSQLISRANSKDSDASEDESKTQIVDQQTDKECEMIKEQTESERQRTNDILKDCSASEEASESVEHVNGQEMKRSERLTNNPSMREEGRIRERKSGGSDRTVDKQEQRRGHKRESNRHNKRQHKRDTEKDSEQKRGARSGSSASSPALTPSFQEGVLSDNQVSTQAGNRAAGCRRYCLCRTVCDHDLTTVHPTHLHVFIYVPITSSIMSRHDLGQQQKLQLLSSSLQQVRLWSGEGLWCLLKYIIMYSCIIANISIIGWKKPKRSGKWHTVTLSCHNNRWNIFCQSVEEVAFILHALIIFIRLVSSHGVSCAHSVILFIRDIHRMWMTHVPVQTISVSLLFKTCQDDSIWWE